MYYLDYAKEEGTKVNYVLQNGAYIAGGDVAPVVGTL